MARYKIVTERLLGGKETSTTEFSVVQVGVFNPSLGRFLGIVQPETMTYETYTRRFTLTKVASVVQLGNPPTACSLDKNGNPMS